MIVTPAGESRRDIAHRSLYLIDGPTITYTHQGYGRSRVEVERTWRPNYLTITWRRGVVSEAKIRGNRLRKDGSEGVKVDSIIFRPDDESGRWLGREEYHAEHREAPDWLLQLIEHHKDNVPTFDALE